MEEPKRKPLGKRPKASRRKVKENEMNIEDKKIRNEVASVLDGLVYLTESVAKLEGIPRTKAEKGASRPKASRRKVKVNEVKTNVEDKKIRSEVASVLDGLVYLTESVAKLERGPRRGHRTKSANNVSRPKIKLNGPKNFTNKILEIKAKRRSRSRKSESDVRKGINI